MNYNKASENLLFRYKAELARLNYCNGTIRVYGSCFEEFLYDFKGRDYRWLKYDDIIEWLQRLVLIDKISPCYQNQLINSVKFYFEKMLHQPRKIYHLKRPRKNYKQPEILDETEIQKLFSFCENKKHWCILALLYECGLRGSEVINLRIKDIDSKLMVIHIKDAKGHKDRMVNLTPPLLDGLRKYFLEYKPIIYLFNGQAGLAQYSIRSIEEIVRKLAKKAGINKRVFPHLLRANHITHQWDLETDSLLLMRTSGHNSLKTTAGYARHSTKKINTMPSLIQHNVDNAQKLLK